MAVLLIQLISRCKSNTKGTVASYIPQLAKAMYKS